MVGPSADSAVFDFENILPQLDFLPIAARRALDHAGLRLSLEAWRSLSLEDRCHLVAAGADDIVDGSLVAAVVRRASPAAQRIEVVGDPDPLAPPEALLRLLEPVPLDARQWARLRALDRYALAHVHRRSIARNDPSLIQSAYEDIVMGHLRSLRPAPADVGGASAAMHVPPPPRVPYAEVARAARGIEMTPPSGRAEAAPSGRGPVEAPTLPRVRRPIESPPSGRAFDVGVFARGHDAPLGHGHDALLGRAAEAPREPPARFPSSIPPSFGHAAMPLPERPFGGDPAEEIPELTVPGAGGISTHLTEDGDARMVDVGAKPITERRAVASARVHMRHDTFRRLALHATPKGDVLAVARIAGIQAAKRTSELIPLCHAIALTSVEVQLALDEDTSTVQVTAVAQARDRTGVEMEALVAASVAGLTIYDMLKGIDRDMWIDDVKLVEKSGGRSGHYQRREA